MRWAWVLAGCAAPVVVAFSVHDRAVLPALAAAAAQALFAASWDLVGNVSGQPSLGHALPLGAGAYLAVAMAAWRLVPLPLAIASGAAAGGVAGAVQGRLCRRLSGVSVMLVTFVLAELAREAALMLRLSWPGGVVGGGETGLAMPVYPAGEAVAARTAAVVLAAGVALLGAVSTSKVGLAMRMVRHDPRAARACGIPVETVKVAAFAIAGGAAGLAGGVAAAQVGGASPAMLSVAPSVFAMGIAATAWPGTIVGPALAAYALTAGLEWLDIPAAARLPLYAALLTVAGLIAARGSPPRAGEGGTP